MLAEVLTDDAELPDPLLRHRAERAVHAHVDGPDGPHKRGEFVYAVIVSMWRITISRSEKVSSAPASVDVSDA